MKIEIHVVVHHYKAKENICNEYILMHYHDQLISHCFLLNSLLKYSFLYF